MSLHKDFSARLSWTNLTVTTAPNRNSLSHTILHQAHGSICPGEFLAIMGPSGAGKTTLLNCLSKRTDSSIQINSGEILINEVSIETVSYAAMIGFVPQNDILFNSMTPREILMFTAALTQNFSSEDCEFLVHNTLNDLELNACADILVGGVFQRGLSGGEKKRTSVGMELISNPCVLFLDEPTTGLDSFVALGLVRILRDLAKNKNRTLVATIHQPSSQIFAFFDKLLLLCRGVTVYMGNADESVEYFKSLGYEPKPNYNPADHFLNILNVPDFKYLEHESLVKKETVVHEMNPLKVHKPDFLTEVRFLTWRAYLETVRNPLNLALKIPKIISIAVILIIVFWQLHYNYQGMDDRAAASLMFINLVFCEANISVVLTFQTQKHIFEREYRQQRYSALAYFISYNILATLLEIFYVFGILVCSYNAIDLNTSDSVPFKFTLVLLITSFIGTGTGMAISIVSKSTEIAAVIIAAVLMLSLLMTGYFVNYENMPDWFYMKWISPMFYSYQAGIISQLETLEGTNGNNQIYLNNSNFTNTYNEAMWISAALALGYRLLDYFLLVLKYRFD